MRLEADDGRPEASPPLRRGVQTADRAVVRERQAIPGDQGRVRHRAIDPAALGPGHPRQRLHPGRGQPHARAERAGRAGEAQQAVGDGGGRFRTSGTGIRTKADGTRADEVRPANLLNPRVRRLRPAHAVRRAVLPMSASAEAGRTCACWPA